VGSEAGVCGGEEGLVLALPVKAVRGKGGWHARTAQALVLSLLPLCLRTSLKRLSLCSSATSARCLPRYPRHARCISTVTSLQPWGGGGGGGGGGAGEVAGHAACAK